MKNNDIKIIKNLSYSDGEFQKLDLYLPSNPSDKSTVVISLHGGSWSMGDKSDYEPQTLEFARRLKLPCVNMNYSMPCDETAFDKMLRDVELAMLFIKEYAKSISFEIKQCILRGFSAGAHIALCYAFLKRVSSPLKICFCVGESLPADLTFEPKGKASSFVYRGMSNIIGHRVNSLNRDKYTKELQAVSPISYVSPSVPPVILLHGEQDYIINYSIATKMFKKLKALNVDCALISLPDSGHSLDNNPELVDEYFDLVCAYCGKYAYGNLSNLSIDI